jgi:diketogulonate reductase-like aldo/keto reductase
MKRFERLFDGKIIPSLGLGTWRMGGELSADYQRDQEMIEAIRAGIEAGYTHIDTAEAYGAGHTEELVRQAVEGFPRDQLFITTKVWHNHMRHAEVLQAIEGSLKRLGTDYVDLYLIHWPNPQVPLEETMRGMNEAARNGLTRYIGVSNFDLEQMKEAVHLAEFPLAANQVPYSLGNRKYVQNGVLAYCQENDILLTAYSPIDVGSVANNRQIQQIAGRYGATAVQAALAWLIRQPRVIAIPKAASLQHLQENLGALDLELRDQDVMALDQLDEE